MNITCAHLEQMREVIPDSQDGCLDCLRVGSEWVHLMLCLTCGHVGCCDSSPNRHARSRAATERHALIQSFEPREDWRYCCVDDVEVTA